jgi:hypothetical protein
MKMNAIKIALLTTALAASAANARDLGRGFSLTGEVELEYVGSGSINEIMSFTDLTLG